MATIGRIDQAVLLLQDRLQKLATKSGPPQSQISTGQSADTDPLQRLRLLLKRGQLSPEEMRKAFVRSLLAESLGDGLMPSLDFQSVADQVSRILSEHESSRNLLDRALAELGLS